MTLTVTGFGMKLKIFSFLSLPTLSTNLGQDCCAHVQNSYASALTHRMAALHKRRHELGGRNLSPGGKSSKTERATSSDSSTVFVKLLAAGFYGVSSFFIVVVNKSVLTNYR